jgi:hypothetical protein
MVAAATGANGDLGEIQRLLNGLIENGKTDDGRRQNDELADTISSVFSLINDCDAIIGGEKVDLECIGRPLIREMEFELCINGVPKKCEMSIVDILMTFNPGPVFMVLAASIVRKLSSDEHKSELRSRLNEFTANRLEASDGKLTKAQEAAELNAAAIRFFLAEKPEDLSELIYGRPDLAVQLSMKYAPASVASIFEAVNLDLNFFFAKAIAPGGFIPGDEGFNEHVPNISFADWVACRFGVDSTEFAAVHAVAKALDPHNGSVRVYDAVGSDYSCGLPIEFTFPFVNAKKIGDMREFATHVKLTPPSGFVVSGEKLTRTEYKPGSVPLHLAQLGQLPALDDVEIVLTKEQPGCAPRDLRRYFAYLADHKRKVKLTLRLWHGCDQDCLQRFRNVFNDYRGVIGNDLAMRDVNNGGDLLHVR